MRTQSRTIDRELFLILIVLLVLAFATRFVDANSNGVEAALAATATALESTTPTALDAAANPYWAPAHAFSRRPMPVYSDAAVVTMTYAPQE